MLLSSLFIVVLLFSVAVSSSGSMSRYSTKTPYIFRQWAVPSYPDFELKKTWTILRHGTRLPTKKVISKYFGLVLIRDEMLEKSKSLSEQQRVAFERWKPMEIKLDQQKFLTQQGEQEHLQLGSRFRERFPKIFDGNYSFAFKHTPTQRTELSAAKFIEGLFPQNAKLHKSVEVERDDEVLRPYKRCNLWRKTVKKNKEVSLMEKRTFESSAHVENLINELRELTQVDHLSIDDIELIYTVCGFETSWQYNLFNGQSVWCSLFNDRQLKVLEFLEDLEYYWIDGHGFDITRKVACKTVEDIFKHLDPSNNENTLPFYFTHSGTILKLLTFLDLYKDEYPLTADAFRDDRLWKTSFIDTFASNLVVALYESKTKGPHIQILHQEQVVNVPSCDMNEHGMCSYESFHQIYEQKIRNCSLQEICRIKDEF